MSIMRMTTQDASNPVGQAYRAMRVIYAVAPILFGLDKFFNILTDWTHYLAPWAPNLLHVTPQQFMYGVGVIEIVAGILVAIKPEWFAYVVAAWLAGIIINLLTLGEYYDVALRDFGLMVGALSLARLAWAHHLEQQGLLMPESSPSSTTTGTPPTQRRAA